MNDAEIKILKKYFYFDSTGFHPKFTSDCGAWNEMMRELKIIKWDENDN